MAKIVGTIMIRVGNENSKPVVVYVSHYKKDWKCYATPEINSGVTSFSKRKSLVQFDHKLFLKMLYQWELDNIPNRKENYENLLKELK